MLKEHPLLSQKNDKNSTLNTNSNGISYVLYCRNSILSQSVIEISNALNYYIRVHYYNRNTRMKK